MTTPVEALNRLSELAVEIGTRASELAEVERRLEPVAIEHDRFVDNFDTGLWFQHVSEGAKLPSAEMRLKLAHKAIDPDLLGRYVALSNARKRLTDRIRSLRVEIDAQRSILSALKVEMEATR